MEIGHARGLQRVGGRRSPKGGKRILAPTRRSETWMVVYNLGVGALGP